MAEADPRFGQVAWSKRASDRSFSNALADVRREAQARYVRDYGHASALYSEKGPFQ